ncbi:MAG: ATP-binding protein [Acidobacteria bacterium]|nr:ATP-binding protein [Acidobacteriota bacterium]
MTTLYTTMDLRLYPRIYRPPTQSFFLFGPRGVGKSTWAKGLFTDARRIDLLDESLYQSYLTTPEIFSSELRPLRPRSWVIVDEIQRLPLLLNEVHRLIEERRLRFVLLGSSARKLKTSGTNLLAGRALKRNMYPLVPEEIGDDFAIEKTLQWGGLALIIKSPSPREALRAYVELYLKEEIKAEALVRNLSGFARFLPIAALFHGQVINVSGLARDAGVARTTVTGYLDILEDTLLAYRLSAFEARLRVRERKHPKLYWIDPGIVRAIKKQYGPIAMEERGALFEGWVAMLLRTYGEVREIFDELYYWAPAEAHRTEVDFLLHRGREFLAIEAKWNSRVSSQALLGLKAISELGNVVRRVLVYSGRREMKTADGIEIWPIDKFHGALSQGKLWP